MNFELTNEIALAEFQPVIYRCHFPVHNVTTRPHVHVHMSEVVSVWFTATARASQGTVLMIFMP